VRKRRKSLLLSKEGKTIIIYSAERKKKEGLLLLKAIYTWGKKKKGRTMLYSLFKKEQSHLVLSDIQCHRPLTFETQ